MKKKVLSLLLVTVILISGGNFVFADNTRDNNIINNKEIVNDDRAGGIYKKKTLIYDETLNEEFCGYLTPVWTYAVNYPSGYRISASLIKYIGSDAIQIGFQGFTSATIASDSSRLSRLALFADVRIRKYKVDTYHIDQYIGTHYEIHKDYGDKYAYPKYK